jgi:hypothetical protein
MTPTNTLDYDMGLTYYQVMTFYLAVCFYSLSFFLFGYTVAKLKLKEEKSKV